MANLRPYFLACTVSEIAADKQPLPAVPRARYDPVLDAVSLTIVPVYGQVTLGMAKNETSLDERAYRALSIHLSMDKNEGYSLVQSKRTLQVMRFRLILH